MKKIFTAVITAAAFFIPSAPLSYAMTEANDALSESRNMPVQPEIIRYEIGAGGGEITQYEIGTGSGDQAFIAADTSAADAAVNTLKEVSPYARESGNLSDAGQNSGEEGGGEEAPAEAEINPELISDAVGVDIYIGKHQNVIDSTARFNLFDKDGNLVGHDEQWIGTDTRSIRLLFSVPAYEIGSSFTLGFVEGFRTLKYYDTEITPGGSFTLSTYASRDENGNIIHGNNFALDADPNYERGLNFYYDGRQIPLWPIGRIIDGTGMIPAHDIGSAMGLQTEYHSDYDSLTISMGAQELIFNMGTKYATFFGNDLYISHEPVRIGDAVYVPARDVLNALGCGIDLWQDDDHIDIIAGKSPVIQEYRNRERVNREGITSRTNYLIWISKSDFRVKVYQGSRYNWECIRTMPCTIGAPSSPTVEGQFEYQYSGGVWSYPNFYVSPTMVFYGGYALHSTLRAWGGGMYDDRTGMMLSHGCVRLHPADIDWLYKITPLKTRVYVTP